MIPFFIMFTSAPVSMSALMGNVLSSTSISIHTFKLSGYSLCLDLLVWLMDLPLPVTLGQNAVDGLDKGCDSGVGIRRSAFATLTERVGSWDLPASPPERC